jgi:hypothetical protein
MVYYDIDIDIPLQTNLRSRDSLVGIGTGYRLDDRGFGVSVP